MKTRQLEGAGHGRLRLVCTLADRSWTEPLPIYAWAIEHPEGVILVDTGETSWVSRAGYTPRWHPYFRLGMRARVEPEMEIGPQLEGVGISRGDVRWVVMTHLHSDHAGGLHEFPTSQILASAAEIDAAAGLRGRLRGYLNQRFPDWFAPEPVPFRLDGFGPFRESSVLTLAGEVRIVPLPGHTIGHVGVLVEEDDHVVLLAGDASYTQELMLRGAVDGVTSQVPVARRTLARIRQLVAETPTVYLPSHDPDSARRLAAREPALRAPRALERPLAGVAI